MPIFGPVWAYMTAFLTKNHGSMETFRHDRKTAQAPFLRQFLAHQLLYCMTTFPVMEERVANFPGEGKIDLHNYFSC